jgi:uncharacterized protein
MLPLLLTLALTIPLPTKPAAYVTDNANVLGTEHVNSLESKLKDFERRTSDQVLVYVDKKVPEGTTLEEMTAQAIHEWGIGDRKKDNGVILFVFTDDRKMRIEVGYGLEGSLTDAKSKLITSEIMKPRLQQGDYAGAVEHGVEAILNTIGGESYKGSGHSVAEANMTQGFPVGLFTFIGLLFAAVIGLSLFARKKTRWAAATGGPTEWRSSSDSSWSSFDSSSSSDSSSDFSSGGGDGGGGGGGDSW